MKSIVQPVKGTRDFYPEQMAMRTWLYNTAREVAMSFGYQEYEAPILESLELYAAKSGEELVKEQSYVFTDRGGSEIALRPELTPSLARMVAQKQNQLNFPLRWWSFGPFWRYERPQKGRTREFLQWNVDLLGADSPEADAEIVAVLATFFRRVGLTPAYTMILVNNRKLMNEQFERLLIDRKLWPVTSGWIDRRGKMPLDAWLVYGRECGLTASQIATLQTVLEDKELWRQSEELKRFFAAAEALGISDYVRYEPTIMRGLLYYTGTVYEAWEVGGDIKRSILGGGRYDNLLTDVGGAPLSAVGFAMGDVVIALLLEKYGLLPDLAAAQAASVLVTVFDQERLLESYRISAELRRAGVSTAVYPEPAKLPRQFKYADKMGARLVLVLGPDEVANGQVTVKDLPTGTQETVARTDIIQNIRRILEARHTE